MVQAYAVAWWELTASQGESQGGIIYKIFKKLNKNFWSRKKNQVTFELRKHLKIV